jgi:hypothetical protein
MQFVADDGTITLYTADSCSDPFPFTNDSTCVSNCTLYNNTSCVLQCPPAQPYEVNQICTKEKPNCLY